MVDRPNETTGARIAQRLQEIHRLPWWREEVFRRPVWQWLLLFIAAAAVNLIAYIM